MIETIFINLLKTYELDEQHATVYWNEIEKKYSSAKRHYHSLKHLEHILNEISSFHSTVDDQDTIMFAVFYHDIVYNVLRKDNEERSGKLAAKRMEEIGVPVKKINRCYQHILATKNHQFSEDNDTNILTDADLSILGQSPDKYQTYRDQVRKEYGIYPWIVYKPGRKKSLSGFLAQGRIYKTQAFFEKYEAQARQNLLAELQWLENK